MKIEHIGIAVKQIEITGKLYERLLGVTRYKTEEVKSEQVLTGFYKFGEQKIELLEATGPESPVARFIDKRGEGIHHIAFAVDDIEVEMLRLRKEGFTLLNDKPKAGADNKLVCFVHPKETHGVLIELCQEIK